MATPNIWTVGTAKLFATISGAIAAAGTVDGDFIEVYDTAGHSYNELVNVNKAVQVTGMLGWAGLEIVWDIAGNAAVNLGIQGAVLSNFTLRNPNGAANSRAAGSGTTRTAYRNCRMTGSLHGFQTGAGGAVIFLQNCLMDNNASRGILTSNASNAPLVYNCTAAKNGVAGVQKSLGGFFNCFSVLAAGNATDFVLVSPNSVSCVSADLTAPGVGNVTGFNTADFVSWAGNDFRISQAARLTTKARLNGYPPFSTDITGRRRPSREHVNFAGCYYGFEQPTWGVGELSGVA